MRSWQITDADLSLRGDGWLNELRGWRRVAQDLSCWLLEPVGTDPAHPGFGSHLGEMIGSTVSAESVGRVKSEVNRVVANYVAYTKRRIEQSRSQSPAKFLDMWGNGEILKSVDRIDVDAVADTVRVTIGFTMSDGTAGAVSQTV